MSRYKFNPEKQEEKTMNEIFEKEGNFFLLIDIRDYKAKIKTCGDVSCGLPAIFDSVIQLCEKSGFNDKEKLIMFLNRVWEEHDGSESGDN